MARARLARFSRPNMKGLESILVYIDTGGISNDNDSISSHLKKLTFDKA
jgi:hypothetical protein